MSVGVDLIARERLEQIAKHRRTVESDVQLNTEYQLTDAATALAMAVPEGLEEAFIESNAAHPPVGWDNKVWENMLRKPYKERLVIAGALIAAEIDRIS